MVGVENFNLLIIPLQLKIEKNFKLEKLASYLNKQLLYLHFFDSCNCSKVMGQKVIPRPLSSPPNLKVHFHLRMLPLVGNLSSFAVSSIYF